MAMHSKHLLAVLSAAVALSACGAPAVKLERPPTTLEMEAIVVESTIGDDGLVRSESYDSNTLFADAKSAFDRHDFDDAERLYGKLLERFPQSEYATVAIYNRGLCLEQLKQYGQAAAHFRRYTQLALTLKDRRDGEFRWGFNLVMTGDHAMALELYTRLLLETDLSPADRVEVYLRRAISLLRLARYGEAERDLKKALEQAQTAYQGYTDGNELVAEVHFRRGEIYQRLCREVNLKLPVETMQDDLAEKARYFRQSQNSFIDALNVRHAYWATAGGLKLGELYEDFYTDVLSAEVPADFDKETKKYYFIELRQKLVPLLEQSLAIYEKNITLSVRVGADNEWVKETERRLGRLRGLIDAAHAEKSEDAFKTDVPTASQGLTVDPAPPPPPLPRATPASVEAPAPPTEPGSAVL